MFQAEASAPAWAGGENVFTQAWVGVGAGGVCQDTCVTGQGGPTEAQVYIFDIVCVCVCVCTYTPVALTQCLNSRDRLW